MKRTASLITSTLSAALLVIPAVTTQAVAATPVTTSTQAADCWYSGSHWWCNNRPGAPVYRYGRDIVVGVMHSNPSWFLCRIDDSDRPTGGGGPHPNRWVETQADNGAWGWMKDSDIGSETDPLPVCG
ncbi:hypothetical protein [Streptomyces sp. NPDC004296]|uniref:hypothetical protein n=1 Tax=Streptomyces sp. NPDC004296 TaxID=3364697 RepID=UPI0036BF8E33